MLPQNEVEGQNTVLAWRIFATQDIGLVSARTLTSYFMRLLRAAIMASA